MKRSELTIGDFTFVLFCNLKPKLWMAALRSNKWFYPWLPFWFHFLPVLHNSIFCSSHTVIIEILQVFSVYSQLNPIVASIFYTPDDLLVTSLSSLLKQQGVFIYLLLLSVFSKNVYLLHESIKPVLFTLTSQHLKEIQYLLNKWMDFLNALQNF